MVNNGLLKDLGLRAEYESERLALQSDLTEVTDIVNRNQATVDFMEGLRDAALAAIPTDSELRTRYTYTINLFFEYTYSYVPNNTQLNYIKTFDPEYLAAQGEYAVALINYQNAVNQSQVAKADQLVLQAAIANIDSRLANIQDLTVLEGLIDTLTQQYQFLRNLSGVTVSVLSESRQDQAAAGFGSASSLISEIKQYTNVYSVLAELGETNISDVFSQGLVVIRSSPHTEKSIFSVLSVNGLNTGGIHSEYDTIENITLYLGDAADTVNIYDSLGQADSELYVLSRGGDDAIRLSNENSPIDPLSTYPLSVEDFIGNVTIDAGSGDNTLLINDAGEPALDDDGNPLGDTVLQQASPLRVNGIEISGLADGNITYTATNGTFAQQLDLSQLW